MTSVATADNETGKISGSGRRTFLTIISKYGTLIAMGLLIIFFSFASRNFSFLQPSNLLDIVNQSTLTAIIAFGLTLVLVVGEFDLSIGYNASLAAVLVSGLIAIQGLPVPLAILIAIVVGGLVGLANALLVTKARVNAVVATLAVGTIVVGLTFGYSSGMPVVALPASFTNIALAKFLGVPATIWYMVAIGIVLWIVLNRTAFGQGMQATGANVHAARLAGIRVNRTKTGAFVLAGGAAAVTGILLASLLGSGTTSSADGYLLDAFAAVFLGAATLRDGEFHIVGTLVGVLIVNIGFNGLSQMGTPVFVQYIFQGALLAGAVALSTVARRYAKK